MPRIARRVVCGRLLVIATLLPTSAFISVDLPTFGRPAKQAKPELNPAAPGGGIPAGEGADGDPMIVILPLSGARRGTTTSARQRPGQDQNTPKNEGVRAHVYLTMVQHAAGPPTASASGRLSPIRPVTPGGPLACPHAG